MIRKPEPVFSVFSRPHLGPGVRLGLAVSGGADSVALLRLAHRLAGSAGWTLRVLHVDHELRGAESDGDAAFVESLATELGVGCEVWRPGGLRAGQAGLEEAARAVRYGWFREKLLSGKLDAIATGHTLDDQAETVLAKLLRGAWTGGLAGIYPAVAAGDLPGDSGGGAGRGVVVRPLLESRREDLRAWLGSLGQPWREDRSNEDLAFTRNRIRREALPVLGGLNPGVEERLVQVATLAREDELFWQGEVARVLPGLLLPGRAVRGGGRASSTLPGVRSAAMEVERLRGMQPALRRRVLRAAAGQMGVALGFGEVARVMGLLEGPVGSVARREQLTAELRAERSPRELRFVFEARSLGGEEAAVGIAVPGEGEGFGVRLRVSLKGGGVSPDPATLRAAKAGDRVVLRHSRGAPKRVKEVLERMGVPAGDRAGWAVLEWRGEVVWMRGAVLEETELSARLVVEELRNDGEVGSERL